MILKLKIDLPQFDTLLFVTPLSRDKLVILNKVKVKHRDLIFILYEVFAYLFLNFMN